MKTKILLIIAVVVLLVVDKVQAVDVDFYSDAVIEEGDQYNNVRIFDTPPDHTTVSMFGGSASFIQSYDSSIFNMFGGTAEACAYNRSTFNVGGGTIYTLNSYDSSNVNVSGGQINHLTVYDTGTVNVWNDGIVGVMRARNSGVVNVRGGILGLISVSDFGTVNLLGGVVDDYLAAGDSGIINVYGYNLAKTNTGGHYGYGFVSGEWIDHTAFSIDLGGSDTYQHIDLITVIDAEIDIFPNTLNLASKGKWVSCHIKLPEDYNVTDIDPNSVRLENEPNNIKADWIWFDEEEQLAMAKFNRSALQEFLTDLETPSEVELLVSGELVDGTLFEGTDTIRVILKGRLRGPLVNSNSKVEDGIEYYIQTDKAVYNLGEEVEMLYRVTNLRDEDVTFGTPHTPAWNFWVEKGQKNIWTAVDSWYAMPFVFILSPGESREFPHPDHPKIWNMRDRERNLVRPGKYNVIGGLYAGSGYYDYTKVGVPIKIIHKPAD